MEMHNLSRQCYPNLQSYILVSHSCNDMAYANRFIVCLLDMRFISFVVTKKSLLLLQVALIPPSMDWTIVTYISVF